MHTFSHVFLQRLDLLERVDQATGAIHTRVEALDEFNTTSVDTKLKQVKQDTQNNQKVIGELVDDLVDDREKLVAQVKSVEAELARHLRDEENLQAQVKSIQGELARHQAEFDRHTNWHKTKANVQDKLIDKTLNDNKEGQQNLEKSKEALEKLKSEVPPHAQTHHR